MFAKNPMSQKSPHTHTFSLILSKSYYEWARSEGVWYIAKLPQIKDRVNFEILLFFALSTAWDLGKWKSQHTSLTLLQFLRSGCYGILLYFVCIGNNALFIFKMDSTKKDHSFFRLEKIYSTFIAFGVANCSILTVMTLWSRCSCKFCDTQYQSLHVDYHEQFYSISDCLRFFDEI